MRVCPERAHPPYRSGGGATEGDDGLGKERG